MACAPSDEPGEFGEDPAAFVFESLGGPTGETGGESEGVGGSVGNKI